MRFSIGRVFAYALILMTMGAYRTASALVPEIGDRIAYANKAATVIGLSAGNRPILVVEYDLAPGSMKSITAKQAEDGVVALIETGSYVVARWADGRWGVGRVERVLANGVLASPQRPTLTRDGASSRTEFIPFTDIARASREQPRFGTQAAFVRVRGGGVPGFEMGADDWDINKQNEFESRMGFARPEFIEIWMARRSAFNARLTSGRWRGSSRLFDLRPEQGLYVGATGSGSLEILRIGSDGYAQASVLMPAGSLSSRDVTTLDVRVDRGGDRIALLRNGRPPTEFEIDRSLFTARGPSCPSAIRNVPSN